VVKWIGEEKIQMKCEKKVGVVSENKCPKQYGKVGGMAKILNIEQTSQV
jgi:hypothetical protein